MALETDRQAHWNDIYRRKADDTLSWYQDSPVISLELALLAGLTPETSVIDIGGGTSRLAAELIARGLRDITVLDLSPVALEVARNRLEGAADTVHWIAADITQWAVPRRFDLWHDRAVFHFLTEATNRAAYLERLHDAVPSGGHAIIATFAPDGPDRCSGLPVIRYDPTSLARQVGGRFTLIAHRAQKHQTPGGNTQSFQFSLFCKTG
ncbi:class I SAM-dependent methyltransferase [Fuscibacter oryzae]|uniref:Class I SAM-dependent methyltransferase n=1 Tax=Fuscibacter oryzae TaxID=2803939 RepID=A0A8J7MU96_9RHOB|nr:class I SAM-dependent methyltransferase [Fuscibacter oryzae]MBL4928538.1 class I SAM-dependent methyltransferase [Fuscibacter oryzae]